MLYKGKKSLERFFLDYECSLIYNAGMELTKKETKLLRFIEKYQSENGASPTVKEMRLHMKLKSDGFIIHCLKSLTAKKAIKKGSTPRSIALLPSVAEKLSNDFVKIPVLGSIPAGGPVLSEEYIEDWLKMDSKQFKNPESCFSLRVRGDSMIDAGIFEGDFVIASSKPTPKAHDIVIALVDGGSTVKRYMMERGKPYLKPANPKYKNIYPEADLEIQGVVVGLFRWY